MSRAKVKAPKDIRTIAYEFSLEELKEILLDYAERQLQVKFTSNPTTTVQLSPDGTEEQLNELYSPVLVTVAITIDGNKVKPLKDAMSVTIDTPASAALLNQIGRAQGGSVRYLPKGPLGPDEFDKAWKEQTKEHHEEPVGVHDVKYLGEGREDRSSARRDIEPTFATHDYIPPTNVVGEGDLPEAAGYASAEEDPVKKALSLFAQPGRF